MLYTAAGYGENKDQNKKKENPSHLWLTTCWLGWAEVVVFVQTAVSHKKTVSSFCWERMGADRGWVLGDLFPTSGV